MSDRALTPTDERDVQLHAASAARRNRPTALLIATGIIFVAAIVFAMWSVAEAGAARFRMDRLASELAQVRALSVEIANVRAQANDQRVDGRYAPQLQLSKLEAIRDRVQMPNRPTLSEQRPTRTLDSPIEKRRVDVTMDNVPLDAAMAWITEAQRAIPDLFVSAIELRPRPNGWLIRVQVARWELRS